MTETEKAAMKLRLAAWKRAEPTLEALRAEDIRSAETPRAMRIFAGSALWAVTHRPALPTSGLVEQQRWFSKMHRRP